MGPVFWVYLPEVINSAALSISSAALWMALIAVSLTVPFL